MGLRDLALSLFIIGCIPMMLVSPYYGLLFWSWISYMSPHRLTWGFAHDFPWVQLVAMVTLGAMFFTKEKRSIPWTPITGLLLAFTAWAAVTTVFAFVRDAAWVELQTFIKIQIMVFVTLILVTDRKRIDWLIWVIAYSIGFYGIKGGAWVLATGGANVVLGPEGSFISTTNPLALALCMVLPLMRYLQMQQSRKWVRVLIGIGMALNAVGIVGTYSRGGMITLAAVGFFLLLKSRGKVIIVSALILLVPFVWAFMPAQWTQRAESILNWQEQSSVVARINTWQFAFNMAVDRPLVGGGFGAWRDASVWWRYAPRGAWHQRAIHSVYFQVLGEHGFVGLGLFLALLWAAWRAGTRLRRQTEGDPDLKWAYDLASMLQVSLIAYMIGGLAQGRAYFGLTYQLIAIFVLIGLEVERHRRAARREKTKGSGGVAAQTQMYLR